MALRIFKRANNVCTGSVLVRLLSSATEAAMAPEILSDKDISLKNTVIKPKQPLESFRTQENDPRNHTEHHLARLYTVPPELASKLYNPLPKKFERLCYTFTETCFMIRKPFLEVVDHMKHIDFSKPAVRFVVYGEHGTGKSLTLSHLLHYGYNSRYILVHVPWVNSFMRHCKDVNPSETKTGMMDVPFDASNWLLRFKTQNEELLKELNIVTSKPYVWGLRETTSEGTPIIELVDFGIARSKFACDVLGVVLKEIKMYSTLGRCKTMVVIDGFNGLFSPFIIAQRGRIKYNSKCTMALPFLDMASYDWCNGVVILSVDSHAHHDPFGAESHLPFYLLGKEGWEHIDPFIPIKVERYNEAEINSILDYYTDRHWLQHPNAKTEAGREELCSLSGHVPLQLMELCAYL